MAWRLDDRRLGQNLRSGPHFALEQNGVQDRASRWGRQTLSPVHTKGGPSLSRPRNAPGGPALLLAPFPPGSVRRQADGDIAVETGGVGAVHITRRSRAFHRPGSAGARCLEHLGASKSPMTAFYFRDTANRPG